MEEIAVLEEQIKNNEFPLKGQKSKDNIIQQLNNEIEQYKIENEEIVNEHYSKVEEYENKIKQIFKKKMNKLMNCIKKCKNYMMK